MKDILSTFGLVNALLLAVVMAIPGSVSYDELTAANIRFGLGVNVQTEAYIDFNKTTVNSAYVGFTKYGLNHDWFAALLNNGPTLYDQFGSDDNFGYSNRLGARAEQPDTARLRLTRRRLRSVLHRGRGGGTHVRAAVRRAVLLLHGGLRFPPRLVV